MHYNNVVQHTSQIRPRSTTVTHIHIDTETRTHMYNIILTTQGHEVQQLYTHTLTDTHTCITLY